MLKVQNLIIRDHKPGVSGCDALRRGQPHGDIGSESPRSIDLPNKKKLGYLCYENKEKADMHGHASTFQGVTRSGKDRRVAK